MLYAVIESPDGRQTRREIPGSERCIIERLPQALVSRRRLLCTCQVLDDGVYHPVVLRSDDDGLTCGGPSFLCPAAYRPMAP